MRTIFLILFLTPASEYAQVFGPFPDEEICEAMRIVALYHHREFGNADAYCIEEFGAPLSSKRPPRNPVYLQN